MAQGINRQEILAHSSRISNVDFLIYISKYNCVGDGGWPVKINYPYLKKIYL